MEDIERKYLEAIDGISKLRGMCQKDGYDKVVHFIDDYFPEVRKMVDVKIAMSMDVYLDWLDGRKDCAPKGDYTIKDYRAWLSRIREYVKQQ